MVIPLVAYFLNPPEEFNLADTINPILLPIKKPVFRGF